MYEGDPAPAPVRCGSCNCEQWGSEIRSRNVPRTRLTAHATRLTGAGRVQYIAVSAINLELQLYTSRYGLYTQLLYHQASTAWTGDVAMVWEGTVSSSVKDTQGS